MRAEQYRATKLAALRGVLMREAENDRRLDVVSLAVRGAAVG